MSYLAIMQISSSDYNSLPVIITNSSMSALPKSFDPFLMQDQLLATLKQSPLTSQLVSLRASQILEAIVQKPICLMLEEQVRILQAKLEEQRSKKRTIRSDSKRQRVEFQKQSRDKEEILKKQSEQLERYIQEIEKLEQHNSELQGQLQQCELMIETMKGEEIRLRTEKDQIKAQLQSQLAKGNQMMQQLQKKEKKITEILQLQRRSQEINNQKIKEMEARIYTIQQSTQKQIQEQLLLLEQASQEHKLEVQEKERQVEELKTERFNLRNELNSYKIDWQELAKEKQMMILEKLELQADQNKLKETIRTNKLLFEKQKKMINHRLYELSATYKAHQKLKGALKQLFKSVKLLQKEHQQQTVLISQTLKTLNREIQDKARTMLDEVGTKMEVQLKALVQRLQNRTEEARTARAQAKSKEETIQRLEKQLSSSGRQIGDLKTELRSRRREEERLRKELKLSYEESQTKLSALQKKYVDLLGSTNY